MSRLLFASALYLALSASPVSAEVGAGLAAELPEVAAAINEAEQALAKYEEGSALAELVRYRLETLRLTKAVIENRIAAGTAGATIEIVVPARTSDPERADLLLADLEGQMRVVDEAEQEAARSGGLMQAMALMRLEAEKLTLARLRAAWYEARHGIAMPVTTGALAGTASAPAASVAGPNATPESTGDPGSSEPWADPEHPEIDYSATVFRQSAENGDEIRGWWAIRRETAEIDDSPRIFAVNFSDYGGDFQMRNPMLTVGCKEGEPSLVYLAGSFIMNDFRSNGLRVTYRIDSDEAITETWSELSSNQGAGVFGGRAEQMIRRIYDADRLFFRITANNGQTHDSTFQLAGGRGAYDAVADACGFSTVNLTTDDYRAIQTLLNAAGFDSGTPDGQWGLGSRSAMRAYQAANGLPETGAPDRRSLEAMGATIKRP